MFSLLFSLKRKEEEVEVLNEKVDNLEQRIEELLQVKPTSIV